MLVDVEVVSAHVVVGSQADVKLRRYLMQEVHDGAAI